MMENIKPDVNGSSSPIVSEGSNTQTQLPVAPVVTTDATVTPAPGSQTPSENLLAALREERAKRKELEDKLNNLNTTTPSEEVYSDEGKLIKGELDSLKNELYALKEEKELDRVFAQYPLLREKANEFKEYREAEHPRAKVESVAKLFLAEQGLLEPKRKGLENPTGGQRVPIASEMTKEDIKRLRENDFRKYSDMLRKGLIKV